MDQATIDALKAKHGEIYELSACGEIVIIRKPSKAAYNKYRTYLFDDERRHTAMETLLTDCVVDPDKESFFAIIDRLPGLAETFGSECARLAGNTKQVEVKKL